MIGRAALLALALTLVCAAPAFAHATLESSVPPDTTVLRVQPKVVTMRWSEAVDLSKQSVRLLDATGATLKTAPAVKNGSDGAKLMIPPGLARGTYVVAWRVVSADSHPVSGAFSFSVGSPSALVAAVPGDAPVSVRFLDGLMRALAFAGLSLTIGGAVLLLLLWPEGRESRRGRRLVRAGIVALAVGSLGVLLLQGPYASGGGLGDVFKPSLLWFSLGTRIGHAIVVRLLLVAAFAWLVWRYPKLAAVCAVLLIFTWTLADHSQTGVQTWLGVPAASVHLMAMALWLGGLVLVLACAPTPALPAYSRLALGCWIALAITGVYLSYRQSGELAAVPDTGFGRMLLIKAGLAIGIVTLAYFSRQAVARGRSVRRTVAAEAVLAVVVLGVTASLVNAAPARVAYAPPFNKSVPWNHGGKLQVHMVPAKQGDNVLDIYLVNRNGTLFDAPEVDARMFPPGGGSVGPLKVNLGRAEPGHYVAQALNVPFVGEWRLRVEVLTSNTDESDVEVPVRIRVRVLLVVMALLAFPAAADAHVTVIPSSAKPGQTLQLTFDVPNERSESSTVQIDVVVPAGLKPDVAKHGGWTETMVGNTVSWTANGASSAIRGARSERFSMTVGPLPHVPQLLFKSLQHYADGQVVRWIQEPTVDADRPAAVLQLAKLKGASGSGSSPLPWIVLALVLVLGMGGAVLFVRR